MKCPVDSVTLVLSERSGIEIDYCPTCRGVWLDRGELDKLVEASETRAPRQAYAPEPVREAPRQRDDYSDGHDDRKHRDGYHKKKKESFLGDLFDF